MKGELRITNPDRILFPKSRVSKLDLVNYYVDVAEYMLPFIKNRLLSVIRCHEGIKHETFFKKHPSNDRDFVKSYFDGDEEYFYISSKLELLMQVQNGTIEFHPWGSKVKNLEQPDLLIFDLDPDTKLPLERLRGAVLKVKSVLDDLGVKSLLKTSGGKGYHIVSVMSKKMSWDELYEFSKNVARYCEEKWGDCFTTNIKKEKRTGKIFIDYLRNNRGSTCVAPYSVRAREGAPISMPIGWEDLFKVKPEEVNIKNYRKFLTNTWDL